MQQSDCERVGVPRRSGASKNVVSTTLREPLEWQNSTLLVGDLADAVATFKQKDGGDLLVIGSTELARTWSTRTGWTSSG